jgi:hypothetical protein
MEDLQIVNPNEKPLYLHDQEDWHHQGLYEGFNEGVSAGIKALINWLMSPCTEHPIKGWRHPDPETKELIYLTKYPVHRKDCPLCMKELEEKYK